jgi:acyl-homoserine-lactone acylase
MLRTWVRGSALITLSCTALLTASGVAAADTADDAYHVTIRRTAHGIPHIIAGDYRSLGYGYAYAFAQDAICPMADQYVTVDAQRAATFGPDATYDLSGANGTKPKNLDSDIFYAKIIKQGTVERLIATPPDKGGPEPEVSQVVEGYVAGWNRYLRDVGGADGIKDPACHGASWVHPLTAIEVWRRFYQLSLLASSGVAIDGIANAAPAGATDSPLPAQAATLASPTLGARFQDVLGGLGSNAVALGKAATPDGHGLLLGNPHFPWNGTQRFYESQLTIPGKIDVAGGSLYGAPVINIGFTRGQAWSHTVSTARRFVPYELRLVPGDPHSYLVDGATKKMTPTTVTVQSRQPDGSLVPVTRTLYDTEYGPMLTSILGLPIFPWTATTGYALYDANAENFGRLFNHFFDVDRAQSVPEIDAIERKWQGIPWVNTIAADTAGRAYYADIGSMPNLDEAKRKACETALGVALDQQARVQVLDGSTGSCAPGTAPGAAAPGILPPSAQPTLTRDDYVTNSNDSYWLSNPAHPLEGFPRVIGDERTMRSPRTRLGLRIVQQRLDGTDGAGAKGTFTPQQLMDAVFNDRQYLGELWRDPLVSMCEANPTLAGANGPVDVSGACPVLKAWDLHDNVTSTGAVLFRRFATRALTAPDGPWETPFDAADPVNTPRGLNTANPAVKQALADAVTDLQGAGLKLDAPLGDAQYELRGAEKIPIHGGPGTVGLFNAINTVWDPKKAYAGIPHGSSYVQVVRLAGGDCPDAHTILTYSESPDPTSPWYADQTRMFSAKQWVAFPFCDKDIAADPALTVTNLGGGYGAAGYAQTGTAVRLVRSLSVRRVNHTSLRVRIRLGAPARVRVKVSAGKRTVRITARRLGAGRLSTLRLRKIGRGARRVVITVTPSAGGAKPVTLTRKLRRVR